MPSNILYPRNSPVQFNLPALDTKCYVDQREFCSLVENMDLTQYQFINSIKSERIIQNSSFSTPIESGTNTAVIAGQLQDLSASFIDAGVQVGMVVQNTTAGLIATVTSITANTVLVLSANIFTVLGHSYEISGWKWTAGIWNITGGQLVKTGSGTDQVSWEDTFVSGEEYKVTIVIDSFSGGTLDIDMGGVAQTISSKGTIVMYFNASGTGITLTPTSNLLCEIDSIDVELVQTDIVHELRDENDVTVGTVGAPFINYYNGRTTVAFLWGVTVAPANGKYTICIRDGFEVSGVKSNIPYQIQNGFFTSNSSWTFGSWVRNANTNTCSLFNQIAGNYFLSQNVLTQGKTYTVMFTIRHITNNSGSANVTPSVGGVFGTARSTEGTFIETITATNNGDFQLIGGVGNNLDYLVVDDVYVFLESTSFSVDDACSNCFCLDEFDCSMYFRWSNDDDAFGFLYENTNLIWSARLTSRFLQGKYNQQKITHLDSAGTSDIIKFRSIKQRTLEIDELPEWMHDALSLMVGHDFTDIDGTEYTYDEDEYEPEPTTDTRARVELQPQEKTQDLVNRNCN